MEQTDRSQREGAGRDQIKGEEISQRTHMHDPQTQTTSGDGQREVRGEG